MKLTNRFNLPQPIVDSILNDDYDPGDSDITVTQLWKSPRIVTLEQQHDEQLETDVIDNIWSLFGKSVHDMLSKIDMTASVEQRLYITREGWKIGGKFDRFVIAHNVIEDYKVTSAYHYMHQTPDSDWVTQQNTYAHILRENGYHVSGLRINALLRDWSKHEAARNPDYPPRQFMTMDLPMWEPDYAERRIVERVQAHQSARSGSLPLCTDADRWARPKTYAVMKEGRKTAVKLFPVPGEASNFISMQTKDQDKLYIQERAGSYIRCEGYCAVGAAGLCDQWNNDPDNPANITKGLKE